MLFVAIDEDFVPSTPFVYTIGSPQCPSITIQDDDLLENEQNFSVRISSTNLNSNSIEISMSSLMITILDNEGKKDISTLFHSLDIITFFTESAITLLPIAAVSEGEEVQVCVLLSCLSCQGTDSTFSLEVTLAISSTTAGKVHQEIKITYLTV